MSTILDRKLNEISSYEQKLAESKLKLAELKLEMERMELENEKIRNAPIKYVILKSSVDEYELYQYFCGVFSTREEANAKINHDEIRDKKYDRYDIIEVHEGEFCEDGLD